MDLGAFDFSYGGILDNLRQNKIKLIRSKTSHFAVFFAPLTDSSKVKAKISKAVQKSQAKCTSQQRPYLILLENKVKGAGIILRRTRTSVFESSFCQYLPKFARLRLHLNSYDKADIFPTGQNLGMLRQNNAHLLFYKPS